MGLYVRNKSGVLVYVTVDPGRPGTKRIVLTLSREPPFERRHLLAQPLLTRILLHIPGYTEPKNLKIFNPDQLVLSDIMLDADGDHILIIRELPC